MAPYYSKRSYSKKKYTPKRPMFGKADMYVYNMAKKALSLINVEYKKIDVQSTQSNLAQTVGKKVPSLVISNKL